MPTRQQPQQLVSFMKFPSIYVHHGAGPMPLLGIQPDVAQHLKDVRQKWLAAANATKPDAIVMLSGHWEGDPVQIMSNPNPPMLYDYDGFPPETYKYKYPAPGSPTLAHQIKGLLDNKGIACQLDSRRGFDHGAFVALMLMFPEANIPVVQVSLDTSLAVHKNVAIGQALAPLRNENVLLVGSGSTFHNMRAGMRPSKDYFQAGEDFNQWLKAAVTSDTALEKLKKWEMAPGARTCHPRADHFMPLVMIAATAEGTPGKVIYDTGGSTKRDSFQDLAVSAYMFE